MANNKYEDAFGVLRLRWEYGEPEDRIYGPYVVELWRTGLSTWEARKPEVTVDATLEVRISVNGETKALAHHGALVEPREGTVRRWARLVRGRNWRGNVKIDGWGSL
jgi:hypothetical protein